MLYILSLLIACKNEIKKNNEDKKSNTTPVKTSRNLSNIGLDIHLWRGEKDYIGNTNIPTILKVTYEQWDSLIGTAKTIAQIDRNLTNRFRLDDGRFVDIVWYADGDNTRAYSIRVWKGSKEEYYYCLN